MTKRLNELIACARRELALRRQVYPRAVAHGRMTQEQAEHEIGCMTEIVQVLERQDQPELEL
jgi:hypothetical protein